jgi:hypothetical protein
MPSEEVVTFDQMKDAIRAQMYENLRRADVPREYTDQLVTALVYDDPVGFSAFDVQRLYEQGVAPEYANAFIPAAGKVSADQIVFLSHASVPPEFGVVGLMNSFSILSIIHYWNQGVAVEYLPALR